MAGPVDPRLIRRARATRVFLAAGVAVGTATAILTIVQAWLLSHSVAGVFATRQLDTLAFAVPGLALVFAGRAGLAWLNQWLAHRAAAAVKSQLRVDLMTARLRRPIQASDGAGSVITLITQGLDALDGYFSKYLPQLVLAVIVPVLIGVAIGFGDLLSVVIVAVTLPLIPVFMALVGWTTEARTKRRWAIQTRLANHFADLVLGLPTLQVFGRARAQAKGLQRTEAAHRRETMGTLRISFLSALVLELLATLSVAVVAVTVGFRVVAGGLDLTTALFVLILAPEAYLPVRQVGVHYHDAADGMAAAEAAFERIEAAGEASSPGLPVPASGEIRVTDLGHTYPGAPRPAIEGFDLGLAPGELIALTGPSGAGKTTILNALMGFIRPTTGQITVAGVPLTDLDREAWLAQIAYVGQSPGLVDGTVADNIRLGSATATNAELRSALNQAGGVDIPLDQPTGDGEGVSAGERRRIAVARALIRMRFSDARLLLLDEPTAGLDAEAEAVLLSGLRSLATTAVVVSHRPAVLAQADRVVEVAEPAA